MARLDGLQDTNPIFDVLSLLTNTLEGIDALNTYIDTYIDDARQCDERELVDLFTRIHDDELGHAGSLRDTVVRRCQAGGF